MSKIIQFISTFALLLIFFWAPVQVGAVDVLDGTCKNAPSAVACQDRDQKPGNNRIYGQNGIITKVTRLIAMVVGVAAIIMLMIGGFKYIIASGDPANIKSAKNTILFALVGLGAAILAQVIVVFFINRLVR